LGKYGSEEGSVQQWALSTPEDIEVKKGIRKKGSAKP
jgi:hypothetical protein